MRTVCLADESDDRRHAFETHLRKRGFEVRSYADGMSAWDGVLAGEHDLCIISHELPDLSGFDLLSLINGARLSVPTIFMTASGSEQLAADTLNLGATCYLVKGPLDRMLGAIDSALDRACRELDLEDENRQLIKNLEAKVAAKTKDLSDALDRVQTMHEDLKSLDRMKSTFITLMSHEIRTPLTSILGFSELISQGFCDSAEEQVQLAEQIRSSGRELKVFVDELMELFQWFSHKMEINPGAVLLDGIVRSARDLVEEKRLAKGIEIVVVSEPEPGRDTRIEADELALVRVVHRVLDNAVKFSEPGSEVRVEIAGEEDRCILRVIDRGIGIDLSRRDAIFRPLEIAGDIGNHSQGKGLGLALAYQAVRAHGGTIDLDSDGPGTGATVTIELPRSLAIDLAGEDAVTEDSRATLRPLEIDSA